jgi:hypothetical protein
MHPEIPDGSHSFEASRTTGEAGAAEHRTVDFKPCDSAQVIQAVRKMYRQLGIRLDYDEAERLFFRRLDDPTINISRGFETNFDDPTTDQGRRIKSAIDEHRSRMAGKIEKDLFTQKTSLVNAERSLKTRETKKSREDVRIATSKIGSLSEKLSDLRRSEAKPRDNRIFPMVYAGVIVKHQGRESPAADALCLSSRRKTSFLR